MSEQSERPRSQDDIYRSMVSKLMEGCPTLSLRRAASLARRMIVARCEELISGDDTRKTRIYEVIRSLWEKDNPR